jgi:hypothetical protein
MDASGGTDIAIGWALVIGAALLCYYGIPFLVVKLAQSVAASRERDRLQRELVEEELDEQLRLEMLAWAEEEHAKADAGGKRP